MTCSVHPAHPSIGRIKSGSPVINSDFTLITRSVHAFHLIRDTFEILKIKIKRALNVTAMNDSLLARKTATCFRNSHRHGKISGSPEAITWLVYSVYMSIWIEPGEFFFPASENFDYKENPQIMMTRHYMKALIILCLL